MSTSVLPPAVTGLNARYFGDSGGATDRYYWVRANYPSGQSTIAGPVKVTTPGSLSKNNEVLIIWNPAPGAISYDVLQTTTNALPTVSAAIQNAAGIDRNSYVDQGDTLATYIPFPSGVAGQGLIQAFRAIYVGATDGLAQGTITPAINCTIPKNAIVFAGIINSTVAVTSNGNATVAVGTSAGSSTTSIRGATAKASLTLDAVLECLGLNSQAGTLAAPFKMSAAGSITVTIGTADLLTGTIEITVFAFVATAA